MEGVSREVIDIVIGHHLHYNRQGYPDDLAGRPLSPLTDMAAIADSYDAMTTMRSYRRPVSPRQAMREMKATSGILLHPEYLAHFLKYLGPYPVGTVVRLSRGETALVTKADTEGRCELRLKILFDKEGTQPDKESFVELSAGESERIVGEVDPFLAGIDLGSLL
jgi:HD-GYP domain-containing protein (c-di-GMP phosphodiesterase class II)